MVFKSQSGQPRVENDNKGAGLFSVKESPIKTAADNKDVVCKNFLRVDRGMCNIWYKLKFYTNNLDTVTHKAISHLLNVCSVESNTGQTGQRRHMLSVFS